MALAEKCLILLICIYVSLSLTITATDAQCVFPGYLKGQYFAMVGGESVNLLVDNDKWGELRCMSNYTHPKPVAGTTGSNHTFLLKSQTDNCWHCLDVLWRTENVLQYKLGNCLRTATANINDCEVFQNYKLLPTVNEVITLFRMTDTVYINCISTFEGVYQFTYEVNYGGGGICDSPNNIIQACQDPGSSYIDNQVFRMTYAVCRDVSTSFNKVVRYKCLGTWYAIKGQSTDGNGGTGYTYAAIEDTVENDQREKFKCLMTNRNQKEAFNKIRWSMSRFAQCTNLDSAFVGPFKLVLTRVTPATQFLTPQCSLPRNLTGTWLTQGVQYMSNIRINDTHIYFNTRINEYEYQETYYSCQQSQGTRYLMTKVVVGKCEIDFTCFDIVSRHHSIVRYRVGKPYQFQSNTAELNPNQFLTKTFREACSWTAFVFDRDNYEWNYETLI
ncbi:hypothetical protein DPMN_089869, partial [Dreissena polymorpha]